VPAFGKHCLCEAISAHVNPVGQSPALWQEWLQKPGAPASGAEPPRTMHSAPGSHSSLAEHGLHRTPLPLPVPPSAGGALAAGGTGTPGGPATWLQLSQH
jgi:hypothetical protein